MKRGKKDEDFDHSIAVFCIHVHQDLLIKKVPISSCQSGKKLNSHFTIVLSTRESTTRDCQQKAAITKKAVPEPSPEQSPDHSTGGEESDGSLNDHSFYNSASDEEPTKKKRSTPKPPPKDKSPTHEEHQDKPFFLPHQAFPIPAYQGMTPSPALITSLASAISTAGPWDPLMAHNICNVDGKFKVPSTLPKYFPIMSV
ncbi:hypothetical protein DSO57_1022503 [Entomophthora muscae]|uniref:Uncharacterized protein n=1 Tax=Entomophthora muscae TaxID=34485 RepID=A0ACC2RHU1_9FUNG|nr:hypothetical protein DSO57_1022503 [Entomophthora muscae]